ncbi:unnamed protein product [Clitoria yellow mottle virus]|nr:unnamed protein product [Clitoria yellow mottle virus]AEW50164.1 replicase [Clitoria yellow mottle virus]
MSTSTLINDAQSALCVDPSVKDLLKRKVYDDTVKTMQGLDKRPKYRLNQALTPEQCNAVRGAYPEFQIEFAGTQLASHAVAAGLRGLELEYLYMQVPFGSICYDIGGNFPVHMLKGRSYVHCCNPALDARDLARNENYRITIANYLSRFESKSGEDAVWGRRKKKMQKPLPAFQKSCFERYAADVAEVTCSHTFQTCPVSPPEGREDIYATSLHPLYDIPVDELAPALLRKGVKVLHAPLHFSEDLILGATEGTLTEIDGVFQRFGDVLTFSFLEESSLVYTHSFRNVCDYITRTFFVADTRHAYMKEFRARRVDTVFCSFIRIDTFCLYRSVFKTESFSAFSDSMDAAWEFKKKKAMLEAARPVFRDTAMFNIYFPKSKNKVCLPIFSVKSVSHSPVVTKHILIDKDFYWTVLNHIMTYPDNRTDFRTVMSFIESVRSRVVINGTTTASQWDVDKSHLKDIALSIMLIAKLEKLKVSIIEKRIKVERQGLVALLKEFMQGILDEYTVSLAEWVVNKGWVKSVDQVLEVSIPEFVKTFRDHFSCELGGIASYREVSVEEHLMTANRYYQKVSDLVEKNPTIAFDIEKFQTYCENLGVDVNTATEFVDAITSGTAGITLSQQPDVERRTAETLASGSSYVDEGDDGMNELICLSDRAPVNRSTVLKEMSNNIVIFEGTLPKRSTFVAAPEDPEEIIAVDELHGRLVGDFLSLQKPINIVYTGDVQICQMKNYLDYLSASLVACVSNLKKYLQDQWIQRGEKFQKIGIWDNQDRKWIVIPPKKKHAWGLALEVNGDQRTVIISYDEHDNPILEKKYVRLAVSTDTYLFSVVSMLGFLRTQDQVKPTARITLVDGVTGCGKTGEILSRFNPKEDLILVQGREASEMIRRRANSKAPTSGTRDNIRTFDSFIMNRKPGTFKTLWIDEGLMVHPGLINFCLNLSGCQQAFVYGDRKQIPFINRVMNFAVPENLAKLCHDEIEYRDVTKRCPVDVTHFLNGVYERPIVTTSNVQHSLSTKSIEGRSRFVLLKDEISQGKVVTFTQDEKDYLIKIGYNAVNTVHEVQGETYRDVSLVRMTATPVSIIAKGSPHLTVALSGHTNSLCYYTVLADVVSTEIEKCQNMPSFLLDMYTADRLTK